MCISNCFLSSSSYVFGELSLHQLSIFQAFFAIIAHKSFWQVCRIKVFLAEGCHHPQGSRPEIWPDFNRWFNASVLQASFFSTQLMVQFWLEWNENRSWQITSSLLNPTHTSSIFQIKIFSYAAKYIWLLRMSKPSLLGQMLCLLWALFFFKVCARCSYKLESWEGKAWNMQKYCILWVKWNILKFFTTPIKSFVQPVLNFSQISPLTTVSNSYVPFGEF